jgi:hypothetical protein
MPVGNSSTIAKPGSRLRELGVSARKKPMSKCTETDSAIQLYLLPEEINRQKGTYARLSRLRSSLG